MKNTHPTAADIMTRSVYTLSADTPVAEAATMLLKQGFSGAPVVNDAHEVVGVFSERDCMDVLADAAWNRRPEGCVADRMSDEVTSIGPDADLFAIVLMFRDNSHRRLPVLEGGKLVGLITRRDVMRALQAVEKALQEGNTQKRYTQWERKPVKGS